jgi:subtilisin family serine protease
MTGRGVKIAVIDSGVNAGHPHISTPVSGVVFDPKDPGSVEDQLGHGTAVTAAIQEKAPDAEYFILKLFGSSLRTTTRRLFQAIEWTIENDIHIVNLSLGSTNLEYRAEWQSLVKRAVASGVVLVSARSATHGPLLPGTLDGVIGVDVDWALQRDRYRIGAVAGSPCVFASGYPRSLPGMSPARNLNGISFAVANTSGFAARACEGLQSRSLEALLHALTVEAEAWSA